MLEFLVIAWVAWQFTNLLVQDGIHAVKGTTPPRHTERMARIARGEQVPQRYGIGGYLRDLLDDALRADVERRRRKVERKRQDDEAERLRGEVPANPGPSAPSGQSQPETSPPPADVPDPDGGPAPAAETEPVPDTNRPSGGPTAAASTPATQEPAPEPAPLPHPETGDGQTARVYQFPPQPQGENMTTTTDTPTTEVTGLASAVQYAQGVAAAHHAHGSSESFVGSLRGFEVGESRIAQAQEAQEASRIAGEKWQAFADGLRDDNAAVREAYQASPDAGNRQFATSE